MLTVPLLYILIVINPFNKYVLSYVPSPVLNDMDT